jgi:hypothetical protein
VLGLRDEIGRDHGGIRRVVGHDDELRGPGQRLDAHDPGDLALGGGDVPVAGTDDDVDGPDRLGAVREGGDRLRTADPVHLVHTDEGGGGQRCLRDAAVRIGRHAQRDLRDAGHACGDRGHEHSRRIGGPAAGHVQPGTINGHDELAEEHAVPLEADVVPQLSFVVGGDLLPRVFEGGAELGGSVVERGEQLVSRHPELVDRAAVELLGQVMQRRIAAAPNLGDDRSHALDGGRVNGFSTRRQRAEVGVRAAKIESGEHQGSDHRNHRPLAGCPNCPPSPNA